MELSLKQNRIFVLGFVVVFLMTNCFGVCAGASDLDNKKDQIEAQMEHTKNEIRKLKLLEKIETNKLYKNQQKLEHTMHSLQKNKKQYSTAKSEVQSLQSKLDVLLAEHRRHLGYTSKRIVQIFKHKRNNYENLNKKCCF